MHAPLPYVAPFARKSAACRAGSYVDIVEASGFDTPHAHHQPLDFIDSVVYFTKRAPGPENLERADLVLEAPPQP